MKMTKNARSAEGGAVNVRNVSAPPPPPVQTVSPVKTRMKMSDDVDAELNQNRDELKMGRK